MLVVDDEPDLVELIRVHLESDGHEVTTACDGERALVAATEHRPDLLVLDVVLPGRDGLSVLAELKSGVGERATIPVLVLTGRSDPMDRLRAGIEGAVTYMTKPFAGDELRAAVAELLDGEAEPVRRRRAQTEALAELARRSSSASPAAPAAARPRLTRLEPVGARPPRRADPDPIGARLEGRLSPRQRELLDAVLVAPTMSAAAASLGVSRSYLYASLRRVARKVGVASGPELVRLLRVSP